VDVPALVVVLPVAVDDAPRDPDADDAPAPLPDPPDSRRPET
jgi:hypothetical protein